LKKKKIFFGASLYKKERKKIFLSTVLLAFGTFPIFSGSPVTIGRSCRVQIPEQYK
jgi:hypothetical protein